VSEPLVGVRAAEDRSAPRGFAARRPPKAGPSHLGSDERSLDAPPVYRRLLAGGTESLRLGRAGLLALTLGGVTLPAIGGLLVLPGGTVATPAFLATAVGSLVCSLLLAWVASRWLGGRLGVLAGLICSTSLGLLGGQIHTWLAAAVCAAIGAFAAAHVPGRLPTATRGAMRWAFHAAVGLVLLAFGWQAAIVIVTVCLVSVLIGQNTRSVRLLLHPVGLGLLAAAIIGRFALDAGLGMSAWSLHAAVAPARWTTLAPGVLPWLPFAALAAGVGLLQGHHAAPFWRLVGCWIAAPIGLTVLGATGSEETLTAVMPPVCVLSAAGLGLVISRIGRVAPRPTKC